MGFEQRFTPIPGFRRLTATLHHPKRDAHNIDRSLLLEPVLSPEEQQEYERGWKLFNDGEFWHAHEAWENVWKQRPEPSRIFFQGIIQLAAAYHLLFVKCRYGGMIGNLDKAEEKLRLFPGRFLDVDVQLLLAAIIETRKEVERVGPDNLQSFDRGIIVRLEPYKK